MKNVHSEFSKETIVSLLPDVTYTQVPFWFNGTLRPLKMDLLIPKHRENVGKQPTIVWVCGGAFQQVDRHIWIPELTYFAKHGFTVASVEYRTSMEANWPAQVIDVKSAIRFLRANAERFCVDPDRIAIMGESAGAYLASFAGVTGGVREFIQGDNCTYSDKVQAVVSYYGLSGMLGSVSQGVQEGDTIIVKGNAESMLLGCEYRDNPQLYEKASVTTWIDDKCPPFLLLHGTMDPLVNISQSEILYEKLEASSIPVEFDVYENVSHGADEFYQEESKQRICSFLKSRM